MKLFRKIAALATAFILASPAAAQVVGAASKAGGASVSASSIVPALGMTSTPPCLAPVSAPSLAPAASVIAPPVAAAAVPAPAVAAAAPLARTALAQALAPAPAAEMPGRLDSLYGGGAAKRDEDAVGVPPDAAPGSVAALLADYRSENRAASGRRLRFTGVGGRDVYNPTAPFAADFRGRTVTVMAGRVEARDNEDSEIVFFEKSRGRWKPLAGAPRMKLQDPFVARIAGELVLGGVETFPKGGSLGYRTVFYRGASLSTLSRFAQGPDGMKDIRLAELPGGRLLVVTRPQGEIGGRGKIAMTVLDGLGALEPGAISRAAPLEGLFKSDEWGGANELHLLRDGRVGVLGHVARFDERGDRHYYPMVFAVEPATGRRTPMKILLERGRLTAGASKRPDLADVLFSGGLLRRADATASLFVGVGDAEVHQVEIADPFRGLDRSPFTRGD